VTQVNQGANVCALTYNDAGQLKSEAYTGGELSGLRVTNVFDSLLRRTNLALASATGKAPTRAATVWRGHALQRQCLLL